MKKLLTPTIVCIMVLVNLFFVGASTQNNETSSAVLAQGASIQEESTPEITVEENYEFDVNTSYAELMVSAACQGDISLGHEYERLRNLKKQHLHIEDNLTFDDLYLLSKIIETETGSNWLTEEHRQMVASVVVNRVKSPEFPNTLYEVVYQRGQYAAVRTSRFENLIPSEKAVRSAMAVLKDGSIAPPSVVFQAEFVQGKGTYKKITDSILGTTYFCYSSNSSLYE